MSSGTVLVIGAESLLTLIALKAPVLLAFGFVFTRITRRMSAAHRSSCWAAVAVTLLWLPVLSLTLPTTPIPGIERRAPANQWTVASPQPPATIDPSDRERQLDDASPVVTTRGAMARVFDAATSLRAPLLMALGAVWAVGVVILIGRLFRDVSAARTLCRRGALAPANSVVYVAAAAARSPTSSFIVASTFA